ncbi:MAG TPA: hypothetical protein VD790_00315 [Thermoleophilaceae bacterium]|nr:hypothetical protein [Thermoleophilaceae bacterium]
MPERLDHSLRDLAGQVDFPPTPDLAAAVAGRLVEPAARPAPRRAGLPLRRPLALAGIGLLLAAAGVFAASPGVRDAVLEFVGIRGASVERVSRLPTVPRTVGPAGERVTLAEARRRAGFEVRSSRLGRPDRVRYSDRVPGGVVTFRVAGFTVTQLRAGVERKFLRKLVAEGTTVERLRVTDDPALWLVGRPHVVYLRDANGQVIEETLQRAGNVLIVEHEGVLVRVEGADALEEAVMAAASLG